jgi:hypothetical protein
MGGVVMKWLMGAIAALMLCVPAAQAQTEVTETGGDDFHIFKVLPSAGTTFKLIDFYWKVATSDTTVDGYAIRFGIKNGDGTDSLYVHTNESWHGYEYPPNSTDVIPIKTRKFKEIDRNPKGGAPDSAVFRYLNASTTDTTWIYVWTQ